VDSTRQDGADELSLSQGTLASGEAISEQMSLKAWTRSAAGVTREGDAWAASHTKLRFAYDFQTAEGDTIRIRLQANLKYAQLTDGDAESQSTKLRAAIRVSVLQQDVASGLAPLQEVPATSAEAQDGLSQALALFQEVTDTATSLFLNSDPADGDSLITDVVDAFNSLAESIRSIFLPTPADGSTEPSTDAGGTLPDVPPPTTDPAATLPAEPVGPEAGEPLDAGSGTSPEAASPEAAPTGGTEPPADNAAPAETEGQADGADSPDVSSTPQPQTFVRSVMLRVRLRVIDSLRNLTDVFDGDSSSRPTSHSMLRLSAQYSARTRIEVADLRNAQPGLCIDAQG
jgi:hypothetical protein